MSFKKDCEQISKLLNETWNDNPYNDGEVERIKSRQSETDKELENEPKYEVLHKKLLDLTHRRINIDKSIRSLSSSYKDTSARASAVQLNSRIRRNIAETWIEFIDEVQKDPKLISLIADVENQLLRLNNSSNQS